MAIAAFVFGKPAATVRSRLRCTIGSVNRSVSPRICCPNRPSSRRIFHLAIIGDPFKTGGGLAFCDRFGLDVFPKLVFIQVTKCAVFAFQQRLRCALFGYFTGMDHKNLVRFHNSGETVGNHNRRASLREPVQRVLDQAFGSVSSALAASSNSKISDWRRIARAMASRCF